VAANRSAPDRSSVYLNWLLTMVAGAAVVVAAVALGQPMSAPARSSRTTPTLYGYEVVHEYPHDPDAFTQGLIYHDGWLYESTGLNGRSSLRQVRLESGEVLQQRTIDTRYFGEGLTASNGRLLQLTPMRSAVNVGLTLFEGDGLAAALSAVGRRFGVNIGASYDIGSLDPRAAFSYNDEGWGLTRDDTRLILSDGSSQLRFLDPGTFDQRGGIQVVDPTGPIARLNELEVVRGQIYANVWWDHRIAIISPDSGEVTGWIDLTGIESRMVPPPDFTAGAVLNGIAYDAAADRLFVTGKLWPRLFEIQLRPLRQSPELKLGPTAQSSAAGARW
jgi:glutamine cyclotransferase